MLLGTLSVLITLHDQPLYLWIWCAVGAIYLFAFTVPLLKHRRVASEDPERAGRPPSPEDSDVRRVAMGIGLATCVVAIGAAVLTGDEVPAGRLVLIALAGSIIFLLWYAGRAISG